MPQEFTVIEPQTGRILYSGICDNPEGLANDTAAVLVGRRITEEGWLDGNGEFVAKPPAPSDRHTWDWGAKQWNPPALAEVRQRRWEQIKAEREVLLTAPITVQGLTLDADAKARENLLGAVLEMQATGRTHRRWTLADNSRENLSLAQLVAIGSAIADRSETLQNLSQDLRELIDAAQSVAEVEAVSWALVIPE